VLSDGFESGIIMKIYDRNEMHINFVIPHLNNMGALSCLQYERPHFILLLETT
jgi:hypothetical protein